MGDCGDTVRAQGQEPVHNALQRADGGAEAQGLGATEWEQCVEFVGVGHIEGLILRG